MAVAAETDAANDADDDIDADAGANANVDADASANADADADVDADSPLSASAVSAAAATGFASAGVAETESGPVSRAESDAIAASAGSRPSSRLSLRRPRSAAAGPSRSPFAADAWL
jgi:hypothetical protein